MANPNWVKGKSQNPLLNKPIQIEESYEPNNVYEFEYDSHSHNHALGFSSADFDKPFEQRVSVNLGKNRIKVYGKDVEKLKSLVEPEYDEYEKRLEKYQKKVAEYKAKIQNDPINSKKIQKELFAFMDQNHPIVRFVEDQGRDIKPLKSLEFVEDHGVPQTDYQAQLIKKTEKENSFNETLKEYLKFNQEQQKEFIETLKFLRSKTNKE